MKEKTNLEKLKEFAYSQEFDIICQEQLKFAQSYGRIQVNEWRNFIDYDITTMFLKLIKKGLL